MYQQVKEQGYADKISGQKTKNKYKTEIVMKILTLTFLIFMCVLQFLPFYMEIVTSFHGQSYIREIDKIYFFPRLMSFKNYISAAGQADFLRALRNSTIHTGSFVILTLIIAFLFGYVLGKKQFRGKNLVFMLLLSTMMVPGEVLMIPNFILLQQTGIFYNNLLGLILPGAVNVFGIFLFKQFMNTIPNELLESADIDGAGEFTKIFKIVFPMCMPVIVTYIILTFTSAWNEYLWPSIIISNPQWFTLQQSMRVFYPMFPGMADEYIRAAGMILISLPIIIIFVIFQRYFLQSVNVSGMK